MMVKSAVAIARRPSAPGSVHSTWTCYGTFTGDTTTSGPILVATQYYDLGDSPGADMIVTSGWEVADIGVPVSRAIVGGTADHAGASGVQTQTLLGVNNGATVIGDAVAAGTGVGFNLSVDLVTD